MVFVAYTIMRASRPAAKVRSRLSTSATMRQVCDLASIRLSTKRILPSNLRLRTSGPSASVSGEISIR